MDTKGKVVQTLTHFYGTNKFIEYLLWIAQLEERTFKKKGVLGSDSSFTMKGMIHFPNEDVGCNYMDWHIMVLVYVFSVMISFGESSLGMVAM